MRCTPLVAGSFGVSSGAPAVAALLCCLLAGPALGSCGGAAPSAGGALVRTEAVGSDAAPAEVVPAEPAEAPARFVVAGDDAVLDTATGLTWAARDTGERPSFTEAERACAARGTGWRMPTAPELLALWDAGLRDATPGPTLITLSTFWMWAAGDDPSVSATCVNRGCPDGAFLQVQFTDQRAVTRTDLPQSTSSVDVLAVRDPQP